jgi:hypothetical protein
LLKITVVIPSDEHMTNEHAISISFEGSRRT